MLPFAMTKTLVCALNELQANSSVDPLYLTNSTLNYKYNVEQELIPTAHPKIAYFGIGTRGYRNLDDQNLAAPYIPSAKNLDLYTPIPIRIVPVDNDLSPVERSNYRMRVLTVVDGLEYWAYYLKKLVIINNQVRIIQTDLTSGVESDLSELNVSDLTPTPTTTSAEGTVTSTSRISVALSASINISGSEVLEAVNVLHNGNLLKANVSEIGIYSGHEHEMAMSDGMGGFFNGIESIYTQLAYHYTWASGTNFSAPSHEETRLLRISSANAFLI